MGNKRKRKSKKATKNVVYNGLYQITKNFKELFILIISILHGELFFIISEHTLLLIDDFNIEWLSKIILFYAVFFRIFQTQILAAIKYDGIWKVRIYDFIIVFITVLFEFIFFKISFSDNVLNMRGHIFMIIFALFGIFGYYHTYITYKNNVSSDFKNEKKLQIINIMALLIILIIEIIVLWVTNIKIIIYSNILIAIILYINIFISLSFPKLKSTKNN